MNIGLIESRLGHVLKPFQAEAVSLLSDGRDVVVSAPTGAGKTAIYQGASMACDRGVTVLLSPLVALAQDQQRRYDEIGLPCVVLNGTVQGDARNAAFWQIQPGTTLITTPETILGHKQLRDTLVSVGVGLISIDESHLYQEWALSLRPAYRKLAKFLASLGSPPVLLCSATLTAAGVAEASLALDRWDWHTVIEPPARENLRYECFGLHDRWLRDRIDGGERGLIYCASRRKVGDVMAGLGVPGYHGGMADGVRADTQDAWLRDGGTMAATKAFGMGVDAPDVRWVAHMEWPASLIDYAQEAGRAGRDGKPSLCVLNGADSGHTARFLESMSAPERDVICDVFTALQSILPAGGDGQVRSGDIAERVGVDKRMVSAAIGWLDGGGALTRRPGRKTWGIDVEAIAKAPTDRVRRLLSWIERHGGEVKSTDTDMCREIYAGLRHPGQAFRKDLDKAVLAGAATVTRPESAPWVGLHQRDLDGFDWGPLERAQGRIVERLDAVRDYAWLETHEERAAALEKAAKLEADDIPAALAAVRKKPTVHRDVKPENVAIELDVCACFAPVDAWGGFVMCRECAAKMFRSPVAC